MGKYDLQKTPSGNTLRSNLNEQSNIIFRLFNEVASKKLYYAYYGIFILLLILSFVDLLKTYQNKDKSKSWEYAIGTLGFFSPLIFLSIKLFDAYNGEKVVSGV